MRKGLLRALGGLLLVAAGGLALLQTPWAKDRLAAVLARRWSAPGWRVSLGRLDGRLPFELRLDEIRLSDAGGEWLQAAGVRLRLSAGELCAGRLVARELSARTVHVLRRPELPAAEPTSATRKTGPPRWPMAVDHLRVEGLALEEPVAGARLRLRVLGRASWDPVAGFAGAIQGERTDALPGAAHATLAWSRSKGWRLGVDLLDAVGGPLARHLPAKPTGPLRARVGARGPLESCQGTLEADAAGAGRLGGSFTLDARPPLAVSFHAELENDGLLRRDVERVELDGALRRLLEQPEGEMAARVQRGEDVVVARAAVRYADRRVEIRDLDARCGALSVTGGLEFDPAARLAKGRLSAELPYLSDAAARLGWPVGGEARLDVDLDPSGGEQRVRASGRVRNVTTPWASAEELRMEADMCPLGPDPTGRVEVVARDVGAKRASISNLAVRVDGSRSACDWSVRADGRLARPFELAAAGRWDASEPGTVLTVREAYGRCGPGDFVLDEPARVEWGDGWIAWQPLKGHVGAGRFRTAGSITGGMIRAMARLEGVPLGVIADLGGPPMEGRAEGAIQLQGQVDDPAAELQLNLSAVRPGEALLIPLKPADAELRVCLADGVLRANWAVSGPVQGSGSVGIPFRWSLRPWSLEVRPAAPLDGRMDADVDLARLVPASYLADRVIRGKLHAGLTFGGSLEAPDIEGALALQNGYYENLDLGVVLRDVDIEARSDLSSLTITRATASDGGQGKIALTGRLDYAPARHFPYQVAIRFEDTALAREDHFRLDADGEVQLDGSLAGNRLSGRIDVRELDYESVDRPAASIPQLDVAEINGPERAGEAAAARSLTPALSLDLDIRAPARVYIRGRGLESEWKGQLRIRGTAAEPALAGSFSVLRGRFVFLGRRFNLESAAINLDGRSPPDPQLDIRATVETGRLTARLDLAGSLSAPAWTLTSDPPQPEDEIMAQLLFNREADRITALQALRLAYGLNLLHGGGATLDVLGQGQNLLRVDQLDIRQDAEDPALTSIAVGKYVGDRVYVEGEKSLTGQADAVTMELELSRSLRLQTISSPQLREGLRLKWGRDY
ncbi:MAG TPA: translocation/assembly module TamB domain-containing protein [Kiritimatiellia bacterium]|nr:translocation/assembly module TamB domain-containing protein [Kiritimatiellia bacterium]HRZ11604.1 translocation/assembly module TamB domain-containing protein [Kiritimatiellia bacterium]HSA16845.1 translocation/assembly module TamB domain-containing protein [Kiritimatiellia bacterium]